MQNQKVVVVLDVSQNRPRVKPKGFDARGWVAFPKHLRKVGAIYEVEDLRPGDAGSYRACGAIRPMNNLAKQAMGLGRPGK